MKPIHVIYRCILYFVRETICFKVANIERCISFIYFNYSFCHFLLIFPSFVTRWLIIYARLNTPEYFDHIYIEVSFKYLPPVQFSIFVCLAGLLETRLCSVVEVAEIYYSWCLFGLEFDYAIFSAWYIHKFISCYY